MSVSATTYVGPYFTFPGVKIKKQSGVRHVCPNGHALKKSYKGEFCSHCGSPVAIKPEYHMIPVSFADTAGGDDDLHDEMIETFLEADTGKHQYILLNTDDSSHTYMYAEDAAIEFSPDKAASAIAAMRNHMKPIFAWCDSFGIAHPKIHYGVVAFYQ
jgi:hypothetical protein